MIKVTAFSRIHLGLIDLNGITTRRYGGIGFMLSGFPTVVTVDKYQNVALEVPDSLDLRAKAEVQDVVSEACSRLSLTEFSLTVLKHAPQHVGLGSKTALLLACISALNEFASRQLSETDILAVAKRGGTSAVGAHGFFKGGIIVDAGIPFCEARSFEPSSSSSNGFTGLLTNRIPAPNSWQVAVFISSNIRFSSQEELDFFAAHTPIPERDALLALACVHHEIVPAALEKSISMLKAALQKFNSIGFKAKEVLGQSRKTLEALNHYRQFPEVAAGMSSLGPIVYLIFDSKVTSFDRVKSFHDEAEWGALEGPFWFRNSGADVEIFP